MLPEVFRRVVTELGNGGPGPAAYGWMPFDPAASYVNRPSHWAEPFVHPRLRSGEDAAWIDVGYVILGDHGCGIFDLLVVTGDERGHVWWSDDVCRKLPSPPPDSAPRSYDDPRAWADWHRLLLSEDNTHRIGFADDLCEGLRAQLAR